MSDSDNWVVHVMDDKENMSIIGPFEIKEEAFIFTKGLQNNMPKEYQTQVMHLTVLDNAEIVYVRN